MSVRLRGLYAITPQRLCADRAALAAAAAAALRGGARLLQYRDKSGDRTRALQNLALLRDLCRAHGAALIVNDDPALAVDARADGVHLGAGDAPLADARRQLGERALIGVTCGHDLARVRAAQAAGASYVSFGRFFESRTKPDAPPADVAALHEARRALRLPICAIGGLTPENAGPLVAAGADLLAAAGGLFDAQDVETAARAYVRLLG